MGDVTGGIKELQWVKENGRRDFYEYGYAVAELSARGM
jgi:hypothetical protein